MSEPVMTGRQLMGLDPPLFNSVQERHPGTETGLITEETTEPVEFVDPATLGALDDHVSRETTYGAALVPVYSWGADCVGSRAGLLSLKTPVIWPYVTGEGVAWTDEEIRLFRQAGAKVYLVNQGDASQPFLGDEFDVETGAITPEQVIGIIQARRERKWSTRVYGTYQTYRDVTAELVSLGLRRSVYWRIADWNLSAHLADLELWGDVYAGQWASPTSNPDTLLPLTGLTLAQADADLNAVLKESTGWQGLWYCRGKREGLETGDVSLALPAHHRPLKGNAMPITLTPTGKVGRARKSIEEIDPDVIEAVDSGFEYCKTNADKLDAQFASKEDAEAFLAEARDYAYQHEPRLVVTGNPLASGVARFRVELYVAPAKEETAAA